MNTAERLKYLKDEIDAQVQRYGSDSARHKKTALRLKVATVFLASIITILLGLKLDNVAAKDQLSNIALVLGGLITIFSAYEAFFDPRSLWIREVVTCVRLRDVQRDLRFWASGIDPAQVDPKMVDMFKVRFDQILEESLKNWIKIRGATDLENLSASRREFPK